MLDRYKCDMMEVRNCDSDSWRKRIVIEMFDDGSCLTIPSFAAKNDLESWRKSRDPYLVVKRSQCRPIPKKKFRPMTPLEVFRVMSGFGAVVRRRGIFSLSNYLYHDMNDETWYCGNGYRKIKEFEYSDNLENWKPFEVEVK